MDMLIFKEAEFLGRIALCQKRQREQGFNGMLVSADRSLFFPFCHSLLPGKRARRMECCDSFLQTCGHVCLPA